jgi:RHS repeat-associated protein
MAARLSRLLVALALVLGAALPSAAATLVRPPTSQETTPSLVPARGADPANARSYFGARYYRADLGRFTTIDPLMTLDKNVADPQRWNRYAYARNNPLKYIDPDGRSSVKFDGKEKKLYFYDKDGTLIGTWDANNNVVSDASIGRLQDGVYEFENKRAPTRHADDGPNSAYGSDGIFQLKNIWGPDWQAAGENRESHGLHIGVGLHSGRADKNGVDHPTLGCVRTTDDAMAKIVEVAPTDPLTTLTIVNNRTPQSKIFVVIR